MLPIYTHRLPGLLLPLCALAAVGVLSAADARREAGAKLDARLAPLLSGVAGRGIGDGGDGGAAVLELRDRARWLAEGTDRTRLVVEVDAEVTDALEARIRETGAVILGSSPRWRTLVVEASLAQIDALSRFVDVHTIKLTYKPMRFSGSAQNQSDTSVRGDLVRASGFTGAGQKVGVVSDSINRTSAVGTGTVTGTAPLFTLTGTNPQNSGDLPPSVQVLDFGPIGSTDEGAGMMELIFDIAPGAAQAFASSTTSQATYAENIRRLRSVAGSTITTDDILLFREPMFQDGPVAQAIAENASFGVPHFSAAGNSASDGYIGTYLDSNPGQQELTYSTGSDLHNWGIGGATPWLLPVTVEANSELLVVLQWNQPYKSFGLGAGSQADLDLYIFNSSLQLVDVGGDAQGIAGQPEGDPFEIAGFLNNTGSSVTVFVAVDHFDGVRDNVMRMVLFDGTSTFVAGPSTYGHSTVKEGISVGAVPFFNAPATGTVGPAESFTSRGGRDADGLPFYFNTTGQPLAGAPERRNKPDLAAPDGGNTSFFPTGGDIGLDADTFPNFFGTSAAAPNAAAVAALLKQRASIGVEQLRALLQATARDVANGTPLGPDAFTGAGLVDAKAAHDALPFITVHPTAQTVNAGAQATFSVTATGSNLQYQWRRNGSAILGANAATYVTPPTAFLADENAFFHCIVSNAFGQVESVAAQLTVLSPPLILTPPASLIANIGLPADFSVDARGTATLLYQWQRDGVDIPGAQSATYTLPAVLLADDGAQFRCVVSNAQGSAMSAAATLTINSTPVIAAPPVPTPNPALTGQLVQFSVNAADPDGQPLTVLWSFGDGVQGEGLSTTHAYLAAGNFTGSVRVTDSLGLFDEESFSVLVILDTDRDRIPDSEDSDDDGDNVSDELEALAGTNSSDANSTPFGSKPAVSSGTLLTARAQIKLSFAKPLRDSISLSGTLPVPEGYFPPDSRVTASIGGLVQSFDLDARGRSLKIPQGSFRTTFKSTRGAVAAQTGKYQLKLSKGSFAAVLADEDLTDVDTPIKKQPRQIRIVLFFAQQILEETRSLLYTARPGSGSAK